MDYNHHYSPFPLSQAWFCFVERLKMGIYVKMVLLNTGSVYFTKTWITFCHEGYFKVTWHRGLEHPLILFIHYMAKSFYLTLHRI